MQSPNIRVTEPLKVVPFPFSHTWRAVIEQPLSASHVISQPITLSPRNPIQIVGDFHFLKRRFRELSLSLLGLFRILCLPPGLLRSFSLSLLVSLCLRCMIIGQFEPSIVMESHARHE